LHIFFVVHRLSLKTNMHKRIRIPLPTNTDAVCFHRLISNDLRLPITCKQCGQVVRFQSSFASEKQTLGTVRREKCRLTDQITEIRLQLKFRKRFLRATVRQKSDSLWAPRILAQTKSGGSSFRASGESEF
jgi:hypothetical protein